MWANNSVFCGYDYLGIVSLWDKHLYKVLRITSPKLNESVWPLKSGRIQKPNAANIQEYESLGSFFSSSRKLLACN